MTAPDGKPPDAPADEREEDEREEAAYVNVDIVPWSAIRGPDGQPASLAAYLGEEQSADEHPLPWRWVGENAPEGRRLVDANGSQLIGVICNARPALIDDDVAVASPYVRAVTERAGAMEMLWRKDVAKDFVDGDDRGQCGDAYNNRPRTESKVPAPWESYCGDACVACCSRALLAEIDAAKRSE